MSQDKLPEPGEFTRIFKRQHSGASNGTDLDKKPNEISSVYPSAEPVPAPSVVPPKAQQPLMPPPAVASGEPGEFTQYFHGGGSGLPPQSPKTQRTPSNVQRPSSNPPARVSSVESSGVFSDPGLPPLAPSSKNDPFSVHTPRSGFVPEVAGELEQSKSSHFGSASESISRPSQDSADEYRSLFGSGNTPPPPRQSAVAQVPAPPIIADLPGFGRAAQTAPFSEPNPAHISAPSEFTVIANGRQGANPPGISPETSANGASAMPKIPINVNVPPILSGGGGLGISKPSASLSPSGGQIGTPLGSAHLPAPQIPQVNLAGAGAGASRLSDQNKLILFFAVLAILAVVLVVVVVARQQN